MSDILRNRIQMVLASIGIFVAGYLSLTTLLGVDAACGKGGGCGEVAASKYSAIAGLPVAHLGLLTYALLFALGLMKTMSGDPQKSVHKAGLFITAGGFGFSLYLMYASFVLIKATCWWCVASAVTMTLLFALHMIKSRETDPVAHFSPAWTGVPLVAALVSLVIMINATQVKIPPLEGYTIEKLTPPSPNQFGPSDAKVTVIEFYDITCPHCAASYKELKSMITEGAKLSVIMRHFPLRSPGHEMGLPAAVFSEIAAEKGKYFQFVEAAFAQQDKLDVPGMLNVLETLGIDRDEATRRAQDKNDPAFQRVVADVGEADRLGLLQTPTFYVGLPGRQVYPARINTMKEVLAKPEFRSQWDVSAK